MVRKPSLLAPETKEKPKELTPLQKLEDLIPKFGHNNSEAASFKKLADVEKSSIKDLLSELKLTKHSAGGYTVTMSETQKETFNEEQLIATLKKMKKQKGIVKNRPYVDMDALEAAIYNGEIPAEKLVSCQEVTSTVALRIKADKK